VLSRASRSRKALTAVVAAPVLVNERPIGVVIARAAAPHRFTPEQVQTLSLLGALVGPTLESARLYVAAQRGRADAEALAEIMRAGAIESNPDRVIAMVCERACKLVGADYAGMALAEPDGSRQWRGMWGHHTDVWQRPGTFRGRGPFARAVATGKTVVQRVDEFEDADDPTARMATHHAEGGRTLVLTPIPSRDAPPGALVLGWRTDIEPTPAQIRLAETLVSYATIVVDNVRARARARKLRDEVAARADELAASEARLRTLYEALSCGVLVKDGAGLVIHANAAAEEILGQSFEQMRGRQTNALWRATDGAGEPLPDDGRPSVVAARTGRPVRKFTSSIFRPNGEQRWLQVDATPVYGPNGELTQVVASFIDITERKHMEEQLVRAQRLQTAGRIAGQVAHDFNNLLAPLVGYPELIKMRLPADHPAIAFCDAITAGARQIADINEDLLTLGRRGQFDHAPTDVNAVVLAAIERISPLPATLAVQLELAPDVLPILGSAQHLQRALVNLLTNAREGMGDIGTVTIRTANAYVDEPMGHYIRVPVGEYATIAVSDNGVGIRPEVRDHIFDVFFTTKVAGKRRGSGLGLSVVEAIVADHHGAVDVESEPGKGTTFTLYFRPSREPVAEEVRNGLVGGTETILVVDDDQGARTIAREYLLALGYQVTAVTSGEEAVATVKQEPVDLLVLDMVMPDGIDGAETYRQVLQRYPDQRAIVVSGFADHQRTEQARALGITTFLQKPVQLETLARAVRSCLDTKSRANGARGES
jgi:PAS domain S-box-containing protein